jgi:phage tail tape-measure protein
MANNSVLAKMAVRISAETADFNKKIAQTNEGLKGFKKSTDNIISSLKAFVTIAAITKIGGDIIEVTSKFQKFEAVLTNTLGSKSLAQAALKDIQKFAATTPFQVDELTASFVKLANQGFTPTLAEMRKLGDLAASQGKSFDQLTEAIIDAQTGEFERLKEFGIRASKSGDQVKFTFKGVETQAKFSADAIRSYILSLGDAQGVSGGMEAISKTLGGQISNLKDSFDSLFAAIGKGTTGPLALFITKSAEAINAMSDMINKANSDPFADHFIDQTKEVIEEFKTLDKAAQESKINEWADAIQRAGNRLNDTKKDAEELQKVIYNTGFSSERRQMERDLLDFQDDIKLQVAGIDALREQYKLMFEFYKKGVDDSIEKSRQMGKALSELKSLISFKPGTSGENVNIPGEFFDSEKVTQDTSDKQLNSIIKEQEELHRLGDAYQDIILDLDAYRASREAATQAEEEAAAKMAALGNIGEQFINSAISGQEKLVQALGNATIDIIDLYYKQSIAAAISSALKIGGPAGLALAGIGIAAVRGLFNKAVGSVGKGGGGGSSAAVRTTTPPSGITPRDRPEQIQLGGTIEVNGEKLLVVLKNAGQKSSAKRG